MVPEETLLSYTDRTIYFTVHTDASDKKLGAVIGRNNEPIYTFYIIVNKSKCNYTTTDKEPLFIV